MTRLMVRIHDLATNEVIDREMTNAEFAAYEAEQAAQVIAQAETTAKAAQRRALLTRLGITEEEARILLN